MNKNFGKWFLSKVKKAIKDFDMIQDGDRVAVGVSGGKDSTTLVYIMSLLKKYSHINFELIAITLDMGWNVDFTPLKKFCEKHEVPLYIHKTMIGPLLFDYRKEKKPCSLCAKLRGGALYGKAKELGFDTVALGHHGDDAVETLFLNMVFTGRIATFYPNTFLDRKKIRLIRPMVYLKESTIESIVKTVGIPVLQNPCPANGHTNRHEMKKIIDKFESIFPNARDNFIASLKNIDYESFWNS